MPALRKPLRPGRYVLAEMEGEWHVLFEPDDLPHHFLSVARFQDRGRATTYAEIEDCWACDDTPPHDDAAGLVAVGDPRVEPAPVAVVEQTNADPPARDVSPPPPSAGEGHAAPAAAAPSKGEPEGLGGERSDAKGLTPDSTTKGIGPVEPKAAPAAEAPAARSPTSPATSEAANAAPAPSVSGKAKAPTDAARSLTEQAQTNRDTILDDYAKHGGSQAEVAARTGVPLGSVSGFMSVARRAGDLRIAAGDAKRQPMPAAAARVIERQKPQPEPAEKPSTGGQAPKAAMPAPPPAGRKLNHAEMIEAAKRAVPAPNFGDRRGVSCKTG